MVPQSNVSGELVHHARNRRKTALRTMEAMTVLDMSAGLAEEEELRKTGKKRMANSGDDDGIDDSGFDNELDFGGVRSDRQVREIGSKHKKKKLQSKRK